jgi:diguanylate cyclase (GGDEF)-like protein
MVDVFGDARLRELTLLSELDRASPKMMVSEYGPQRDMLASLVERGFVLGRSIAWGHEEALLGTSGIRGESALERMIQRIRVLTLSLVLGGNEVTMYITHEGRLRLAELRETLKSNRNREPFGILWDGRHFETDVRIALLGARPESAICITYLDLNGLKKVNDEFGHDAGNVAIRAYFDAIGAALESRGEAYRVGGDEVIAIIHDNKDSVLKILKKACLLLMSERLQHQDRELPSLSISVGIAIAIDPGVVPDDLRRRADMAMYRAKATTRQDGTRPSAIAVDGDDKIISILKP